MNETARQNPLIELLITLIMPSFILMKLSGPEDLGALNALLLALAFPFFRGAWSLFFNRKVNMLAVLRFHRQTADSDAAAESSAAECRAHPGEPAAARQHSSLRGPSEVRHLDAGRLVPFLFRYELFSGHMDCHQPGRHPGFQRGTGPYEPAQLSGDRAAVDADHAGAVLLSDADP